MVYDSIIDDDRSKKAFGLLMSLNMLIETPCGFDKEARFREPRVEHLVGLDPMAVRIKIATSAAAPE